MCELLLRHRHKSAVCPLASESYCCGAGRSRVLACCDRAVIAAKQGQLVQRAEVIAAAQG